MRSPLRAARRTLRWELRRLRTTILRLRRREGTLSFYIEQGGSEVRMAQTFIAGLQCVLSDHLVPAAEALERELANQIPLDIEPEGPSS